MKKSKQKILWLTVLCITQLSVFSQTVNEEYAEVPEDPFIHVPRADYKTSPAYFYSNAQIFTTQVNVNELGENMLGDAANEPSFAIDPNNPERMAMGWRQFDTIASNFRQAGFAYSLNGGTDWAFPGPLEPGVFRSDPVLDFDVNGTFYYNSLKTGYACDVFQTISDSTWGAPTPAYGGDKQWMVVDRTGGESDGNIYAFWKPFLSVCTGAFTRSADAGATFDSCTVMPNDGTRGTLSVGPEGELYACGETNGTFYLAKSSNAGMADEEVAWDFSTTVNMGGRLSLYQGPNPNGMLGQVWVTTDHSEGEYRGNVYMVAPVEGFQPGDNADIVFAKSEDGGETWSTPIKINDDDLSGTYQWFGTISVAPNGRIDVVWVDTRDEPGSFLSALYYSYSLDGGTTWSVNEKLSDSFDPHLGWPQQNKIGDYYHMISDEDGAHLAWAATFNGEQDVYYSYITSSPVSSVADHHPADGLIAVYQNSPNPFSDFTEIKYALKSSAAVQIEVHDVLGNKIAMLKNGYQSAGDYSVYFYPDHYSLNNGLCFYQIKVEGHPPIVGRMVYGK
ncbi:MAG: hypothetical protein AAFZ15_03955 [Bacteroidota bacterium]